MTRQLSSAVAMVAIALAVAGPLEAAHGAASNPVTDWAAIVQPAIHNAAAPRSAGTAQVLQTMVQLAIYDAVIAIEGGYEPYALRIRRQPHANVRAAVATAAYLTARERVLPSQLPYLDGEYERYLAGIPDDDAKADGIRIGRRAARALLAKRADDGFGNVIPYECRNVPPAAGEFDPDTGCPAGPSDPQPVDAKVGQIRPFVVPDARWFRPDGPDLLASRAYAADFEETRDYGRADSTVRTAEQTDVAYFWSEHPYVFWNRNLIAFVRDQRLGVRGAARLLALVHTSVSDAIIAGFQAKYEFVAWRPRTAIPRAVEDGNPRTDPDPSWTPLLRVNHPEYPSGHGFWSGALTDAIAAFFGTDRIPVTLTVSRDAVPQVVKTTRTYRTLDGLMREVGNARVWGGLHWRDAIDDGARMGRQVVSYITWVAFRRDR